MNNEQKTIVIGNWKMNPQTLGQAESLLSSIKKGVGETKNVEIVICPPYIYLPILMGASAFGQGYDGLAFGSQNCFWKQSGAFTGEISPEMLKKMGCQYVIIGHSERRQNLRETNKMISKKLKAALDAGLKPILCIGETEEQRKQGKTEEILSFQLRNVLSKISQLLTVHCSLFIVYEPIWAIGTNNPCNPKDAFKTKLFIEKVLTKLSKNGSWTISILYGGSIDSKNAKDYVDIGFNGLLVGNASLKPKEFVKIVKTIDKIR